VSLRFRRLGPGLHVLEAHDPDPSPGNQGFTTSLVAVEHGPRLWLVGAGPTPRFAQSVREALGRPVTDLVFTRPHGPLTLGAAAFGDARRWALGATAAAMARDCATCRAQLAQAIGTEAASSLLPSLVRLPDHRVDPPGHTSGRLGPFHWRAPLRAAGQPVLVLQVAGTGWWVAQGLVWPGAVPDLRGTDEAVIAATWRGLHDAMQPGGRVIGERGGPGARVDLQRHARYLHALRRAVDDALAAGHSAGEAALDLAQAPAGLGKSARDASAAQDAHGAHGLYGAHGEQAAQHALNVQRVWRTREEAWLRAAGAQPAPGSSRRSLR
jgi:hypothetical protein